MKQLIKIKVDPHTHTIFSGHAFSTIEENAVHAARAGMEAIGMTDHYGPMFVDLSQISAAMNMSALPEVIHGVRILAGTEIDIVDACGHLAGYDMKPIYNRKESMSETLLKTRELTIASVHYFEGIKELTPVQSTELYCNVIDNPYVHILGHIGRSGLPFEIDPVIKAAAQAGKIIEINEHSFSMGDGVISRCLKIAQACAKHGARICVSSDAHSGFFIGRFDRVLNMLEDMSFPEELVVNTTLDRLTEVLASIKTASQSQ